MSLDVASAICSAAYDLGLVPFVRTPEREYGAIGRLLDGGALGIVAPRIETAEEAATVVRACRFPPRGQRSQLASVPMTGMRPTPAKELNPMLDAATIVKVLIETPLGVANADAIAAIDGVDVLALGANDLTAELGHPGPVRPSAGPRGRGRGGRGLPQPRPAVHARRRSPTRPSTPSLAELGACPLLLTGMDTDLLFGAVQARADAVLEGIVMTTVPLETTPMRAAETNTLPTFELPPGSCDAHFHVFEPGYPHVPNPLYTFPDGTLDQYLALTEVLGISRLVLVQPTFYGTDNRLTLDVLRRLGDRCRAVVRVEDDVTDAELDEFHEARRPRAAPRPLRPGRAADCRDHRLRTPDGRAHQAARLAPAVLHTGPRRP